jgi:flavodoxin
MNSGVVFYSRSNNTRTAAFHLAGINGAEIVELVEINGGKGLFGLIRNMWQASKGQLPGLEGSPWKAIERLDKIYLITPIWGGEIAPAMASFLLKADFKGKEAVVVTFQGDRKGEGSSKVHDKIKKLIIDSGGSFREGYALHSAFPGKYAGKEFIENQIDKHFRKGS